MRGMFTAGVTDVLMEHAISFDGAIGVSAGAAFGCNFKSGQPGRAIRYNMKYCRDKRYASIHSLLTTGDLYGEAFCYREIPESLDLFDYDAYEKNPMPFYVVCTDVMAGQPIYHNCATWRGDDRLWMQASASMPLVSRPVHVAGYTLLDGGITDSIPLRKMESLGYEKNVVVLTQPEDYVKHPSSLLPVMRVALRKYPRLIAAMEERHEMYNETLQYIRKREKEGAVLVIRPKNPLSVGKVEKDPEKLRECYETGRRACSIKRIQTFLCK